MATCDDMQFASGARRIRNERSTFWFIMLASKQLPGMSLELSSRITHGDHDGGGNGRSWLAGIKFDEHPNSAASKDYVIDR